MKDGEDMSIKKLKNHSGMTIKYFIFPVILFCCISLSAQNYSKRLKIGDKVPDLTFTRVFNYANDSISLSDFRGKLVILDFWNYACIPCVTAFPKMEKIQDEFKDKIQVLLVNCVNPYTSLQSKGFPKSTKIKYINSTKLPFVITSASSPNEDREVEELFAHAGEPFHVWIDTNGVVIATTNGHNTTIETVRSYFSGAGATFRSTNFYEGDVDYSPYKSMVQINNRIFVDSLEYSSVISRNLPFKYGSGVIYSDSTPPFQIKGRRFLGKSIKDLFRIAYHYFGPEDRIFLQVNNPQLFIEPTNESDKDAWYAENRYCYESILPPSLRNRPGNNDQSNLDTIMQQDLLRYFGIVGIRKYATKTSRVLIKNKFYKPSKTKFHEPIIDQTHDKLILNNVPVETLLTILRRESLKPNPVPFIDETGLDEDEVISVEISGPLADVRNVQAQIKKYGFDLIVEERKIEIFELKQASSRVKQLLKVW